MCQNTVTFTYTQKMFNYVSVASLTPSMMVLMTSLPIKITLPSGPAIIVQLCVLINKGWLLTPQPQDSLDLQECRFKSSERIQWKLLKEAVSYNSSDGLIGKYVYFEHHNKRRFKKCAQTNAGTDSLATLSNFYFSNSIQKVIRLFSKEFAFCFFRVFLFSFLNR